MFQRQSVLLRCDKGLSIKHADETCTVRPGFHIDIKIAVTVEKETENISSSSIYMFSLNTACRTITERPRKGSYARYGLL